MTRGPLLSAGLALASLAFAQPPPGYYDSAAGLTGPALKQALYEIISPHTVHTYSQLWTDFQSTDDRSDGHVWDIYSDIPGGTAPYLYSFGTDQCGTYDSEGDCYNREHTVPQSWFNSQLPMVTDLFHIYPTDGWVNQKRGDLPYGLVGGIDFLSQNGTKTGSSVTPGYGGTVCEPIDAFKGDIARNYFYMMTRYMTSVSGWSGDMFSAGDLSPWAENLLVDWHLSDPVSPKETDRNNAVFAIQNNRNPYIDHPEWVVSIWGPTAGIMDDRYTGAELWIAGGTLYRASATAPTDVTITDMAGRTLTSERFVGHTLDLPSDLPHGLYSLRAGNAVLRFMR